MYKIVEKDKLYMAEDADLQLHVADVYDLAADIGREFEKLIDIYGADIVRELMTKVIITLEYLESGTAVIDDLQSELMEIKQRVKQLEYEKLEKAEFRNKLDHELEQIEENWRKEINQLNTLVAKLQEENKRLGRSLAEKDKQSPEHVKAFLTDDHLEELKKLKEVADHQRGQLLNKDRELLQKCSDFEKLQMETEDLTKSTRELYHKNRHLQKQMHSLIEEKSDLQTCVQDQHKEYQALQKMFNEAVKENFDLSTAEAKATVDLTGKLIVDVDDPNQPRFTLDELRHILLERNDLKAKVSDLEDEMNLHRPKTIPESPSSISLPATLTEKDEELPVQGPINREPDDKLYPNKKSLGIRRFFRFLRRFSEESPVPIVTFSASPQSAGRNSCSRSSTFS